MVEHAPKITANFTADDRFVFAYGGCNKRLRTSYLQQAGNSVPLAFG